MFPPFLTALSSDGTIAGSASNLYECMCNAVAFGTTVPQAVRAATIIPARQLGRDGEIGSIEVGKLADFVVCDEALQRESVWLGGEKL